VHLSQLAVALRADCSPAMVGLIDRGYRPHRSAVIDRIDRVLRDAEQNERQRLTIGTPQTGSRMVEPPNNDEDPAGKQGLATTSAGVGDGHVYAER